ncbi:FliG C-terminal domain protein [Bacteriovorax sp. BSW11_IV]|uniref:FliG C-terminal domain-containing protein n=1 Tax=Bacteriovorax sp. BSW11_IV TaxID=1353529 RepID=UPI00038A51C4|nr:FliG C-terminal domain-containing protein [Bacteriovorax sp. BSW11_IV]EQC44501.1 FliG C-terminal domain protein [Bacteriovorax sp. BSW11_IV]
MAKKLGGVLEAAKLLQSLAPEHRKNLIEQIAKKDPQMALQLRQHMVTLEDLAKLTLKMKVDLLKRISLDDLALSLKVHPSSLQDKIMEGLSSSMKQTMIDVFTGPPVLYTKVAEAERRVLDVVLQMHERGEISFSNNDEYV